MCRHIYNWNIVNCDVKQPNQLNSTLKIYDMVAITFIELKVYESSNFSISLPSGCVRQFSENIGNISQSNMAFYMILSLTTRVFPVLVLCVTTIMLAHSLQKRRSTLAYNTRTFTGMTRTFSDNRRVTRMIFPYNGNFSRCRDPGWCCFHGYILSSLLLTSSDRFCQSMLTWSGTRFAWPCRC